MEVSHLLHIALQLADSPGSSCLGNYKSFNSIFHSHCKFRKLYFRSRPLPVVDGNFTQSGIKLRSLSLSFMFQIWSPPCFLVKSVTKITVRIQKLQHSGEQPPFVFFTAQSNKLLK